MICVVFRVDDVSDELSRIIQKNHEALSSVVFAAPALSLYFVSEIRKQVACHVDVYLSRFVELLESITASSSDIEIF